MQFRAHEFDYTQQVHELNNFGGRAPANLIPRFYYEREEVRVRNHDTGDDQPMFDENGAPMYREVECIEIIIVGNNRSRPRRRVTEKDKLAYADAYRAWKEGRAQAAVDGTPLDELPGISESIIQKLAFHNVTTIEQLAGINELSVKSIGLGAAEYSARAQQWLQRAQEHSGETKMAIEFASMRKQLDELVNRVRESEAQNAAYKLALKELKGEDDEDDEVVDEPKKPAPKKRAPAKKGRGRKKANATADLAPSQPMSANAIPADTPIAVRNADSDGLAATDDDFNPMAAGDGDVDPVDALLGEEAA